MPKGKECIVSGLGHLRVRNSLGLCVRLPYWCWLENCGLIKTTFLGEVVFKLGTWSWFAEVVWEELTPFGAFCFFFQFSPAQLVAQLCLTLCKPMDCSTPGLPSTTNMWSLLKLMPIELAIQPSHPLLSPSPPVFNHSQHQGLFQESVLRIRWPKYWEFQLHHQSFQWTSRTDFL